jgi:hypothetical protein
LRENPFHGFTPSQLLVFVGLVVLEAVQCWQLTPTQDANDPDTVRLWPVEHHVAHIFGSEEPRTDVVAGAAYRVAVRKPLAEVFKLAQVFIRLGLVPLLDRLFADAADIGPRERR